MTDTQLLVAVLCIIPAMMFIVALFACELRIQYRDGDTRRYPRYGQSDDMRDNTNHKFRVKSRVNDKET